MSNGAQAKPKPKPEAEREPTKLRPLFGPRPVEQIAGGFLFAAGAYLFEKLIGVFSKDDDEEY